MFDVKISAIAAGIAFVTSFLLGLVSGVSLPALIIRPLVFAVLFFIIAGIVYRLVSHFLPELLEDGAAKPMMADDILNPGSRINITEGDPGAAVPAAYAAPEDDSEDNLGDIADLLTQNGTAISPGAGFSGLDQRGEDGYNRSGVVSAGEHSDGGFSGSRSAAPKTSAVPDLTESVDVLPDLDVMAKAFLPNSGEDGADTIEYSTSDNSLKRPAAGGRGQKMDGDFNPKELAAGIRTILKKEG
jgi:hypothetical protein